MSHIKFRVWDVADNEWLNPRSCTIDGAGRWRGHRPHVIIEQFTGLTDKRGREIYEGDIVEITGEQINPGGVNPGTKYTMIATVRWDHQCTGFSPFNGRRWYENKPEYITVIGNVHEES